MLAHRRARRRRHDPVDATRVVRHVFLRRRQNMHLLASNVGVAIAMGGRVI